VNLSVLASIADRAVVAQFLHYPPCVYFLVRRGVIVYVGSTKSLGGRVGGHVASGKAFDEVVYVEVQDKHDRFRVETALIHVLRPRLNGARKTRVSQRDLEILIEHGFSSVIAAVHRDRMARRETLPSRINLLARAA
jgi:hypothetical protein